MLCIPDALDLPEYKLKSRSDQRDAVIRWLKTHQNWLLILDNVDSDEAAAKVQKMLGSLTGGQIIITTRITQWGGCAHELTLNVISVSHAVKYLLSSTDGHRIPNIDDDIQAELIVKVLGCLPLMLNHASAYIRRYPMSLLQYRDEFENKLLEIIKWHDHNAIKYEIDPEQDRVLKTVATTYFMSYDRLHVVDKVLLRVSGLLSSDPIPVDLFCENTTVYNSLINLWCAETGEYASEKTVRDAIADLAHISLISQAADVFEIHRVEQRLLENRIVPCWRDKWVQAVANLLHAYTPYNSQTLSYRRKWYHVLPHAEFLWNKYQDCLITSLNIDFLDSLARYYFERGLDERGVQYAEKVVDFYRANEPTDSPIFLQAVHLLGYLHENNNEYEKAEALFREELAGWERREGKFGKSTLRSVHRLACLLGQRDKYSEAEKLFKRSISGSEQIGDPEVYKRKQDLGWLYYREGKTSAAEQLYRIALPGLESGAGIYHYDTCACANNLALVLQAKGELDEAERLLRQALKGSLINVGTNHRQTQLFSRHLASILNEKGDKEKQLNLQLEILETREQEPEAKNDRSLPIDQNNLALEYRKIELFRQAESLLRRALAGDIRMKTQAKIPHRLNNIATVLILQGNLAEAREQVSKAWALKSCPHDLTSSRILFIQYMIALLESKNSTPFIGKLKTLLAVDPLPDHADVARVWDIAYFIEYLRPKLPPDQVEFLMALAEAMNDPTKLPELDKFPLWRDTPPLPLD
jgi:tetratricopeptide (TPR) repeat protein